MERQIEGYFKFWKNKQNKKPLILLGARQVGKTYALKRFGKAHYRNLHYFDLEELQSQLMPVFEESLSPKNILEKIGFITGRDIDYKKDLLVFDEIQAIPAALTSLKYFQQNLNELDVIACGSNLGVHGADASFPVGKVEIVHMYPMNFQEFLMAIGEDRSLDVIEQHTGRMDDLYHNHLLDLLRRYFIVGGMPEAVAVYKSEMKQPLEAFEQVRLVQKQLLLHYDRDFAKYSGDVNSRHIGRIFQAIPAQLSRMQDLKSKKFIFKDVVSKGYRSYNDLADPIDWLTKAGLALKIDMVEHPQIPLFAQVNESSFKLFLFDVGLLGYMVRLAPSQIMNYDYGSFKGYFAENFVLQELRSYDLDQIATWTGRTSEIEFVVEMDNMIIPVEVKAGTNTRAKSLQAYMNKYEPRYALKFSGNKPGFDSKWNVYNFPLYMVSAAKSVTAP